MKNGGGHFAPELGGHFELESGAHFKLELGGQYHWNLHTIMQHYVKKLWEKKYWHELRSVRVIAPITMTVIFLELWQGVAIYYAIVFKLTFV